MLLVQRRCLVGVGAEDRIQAQCAPPRLVRADGDRHRRALGGPATKVFSGLWPERARAFRLAELDAAKRRAADDTDD